MTEKRSESIAQLAAALAIAQGQIKSAPKEAVADTGKFKYSYATLDSIWDAARKPLSDNGLSVVQIPTNDQDGFSLETILVHLSGEWISGTMTLPLASGRMSELQSMGSAITYARRYMLGAMVGVTTGDDDDGRQASQSQSATKTEIDNRPWQEKSPPKLDFFIRAARAFNLETQDIIDQLKSHGFDKYMPASASVMWAILKEVPKPTPSDEPQDEMNRSSGLGIILPSDEPAQSAMDQIEEEDAAQPPLLTDDDDERDAVAGDDHYGQTFEN